MSVQDWILAPHHTAVDAFVDGLVRELNAAGVPVARCSTSLLTTHPEIFVRSVFWERGEPLRVVDRPHALVEAATYVNGPVRPIHAGAPFIRCRLEGDGPLPYDNLDDLREDGLTDYLIVGLPFTNGRQAHLSFATARPGGFTDAEVALLRSLVPALAVRIELLSAQYATEGLLRVYLGPEAARRVGKGEVRRGTGQELEAAIWYCDMRNFTVLGDAHRPAEVVALLDAYFDAIAGPIQDQGGEILKFIGDAVLAIFPLGGDGAAAAARRALVAARAGLDGLAGLNARRSAANQATVGAGIALHLGTLLYGNIGTRERLDFTAIGATVNEAARIEGMCKDLETNLLASRSFVDAAGASGFASAGAHALKGVSAPMELFRLA